MLAPNQATDTEKRLLATFRERAVPLGIDVHQAATIERCVPIVADLARQTGADIIFLDSALISVASSLTACLDTAGLRWEIAGSPDRSNSAPLGLSLAVLAVAETASVLLAETSLEDRGIGLLVATHLVLCPTSRLLASLDDAAPVLRELAIRPGGAYTTLVTGPSRTADIERVLTVGVQGPKKVCVVFVDEIM